MNTSITISKLGTLAFTILLATNLCGMESNAGKRKRNEQTVEIMDFGMQTTETLEQRDLEQKILRVLLARKDCIAGNPLHQAIVYQEIDSARDLLAVGADVNALNKRGESPLCIAARKPDSRFVHLLVSQPGIHLNEPGEDSYTAQSPLALATCKGNEKAVKILLNAGVSTRSKDKSNPLLDWCSNKIKKNKIAELFIKAGVDVNGENSEGNTPLEIVLTNESRKKTIEPLLSNGANIFHRHNKTGLSIIDTMAESAPSTKKTYFQERQRRILETTSRALIYLPSEVYERIMAEIFEITPDTLNKIIQYGSVKTVERYLNSRFLQIETKLEHGTTPLHHAACLVNVGTATVLLDRGAMIDARGNNGNTPLHCAATFGRVNTATVLLDRGAMIDAQGNSDDTPLHHAAIYGRVNTATVLLDRGAMIDARGDSGGTPLHCAATLGRVNTATVLLNRGAMIDARDNSGRTPLLCAATFGRVDTATVLLNRGAMIDARGNSGGTPLHYAACLGNVGTATVLLNHGAMIDAQSNGGETPLHYAYRLKHLPLIKLLQERGADMTIKDNNGKTPQDYLDAHNKS